LGLREAKVRTIVMAGLVPAIHVLEDRLIRGGWIYIMTNRANGVLYVGVTSDLIPRVYQHREGLIAGFTKTCGLKMLVYFEQYGDIRDAIQRERTMKHWPRAWKVRLILKANPQRRDLFRELI
jgi:putative endonuclease